MVEKSEARLGYSEGGSMDWGEQQYWGGCEKGL